MSEQIGRDPFEGPEADEVTDEMWRTVWIENQASFHVCCGLDWDTARQRARGDLQELIALQQEDDDAEASNGA